MQLNQLWNNKSLNLNPIPTPIRNLISLSLLNTHSVPLHSLRQPNLIFNPRNTLTTPRLWNPQPALMRCIRRNKDNLPLPRGEQVTNNKMKRIPLQGSTRFVDKQGGIRL